MAVVGAVVVGYYIVRSRLAPFVPTTPERELSIAPPKPSDVVTPAGSDPAVISGGRGLRVQLASKADPTRLAARINSTSLEPLEGGRYAVEKPEAFLYLKGGRTMFVRAQTAKLYMPRGTQGEPESGTLNGDVFAAIFEPRADGSDIDPSSDSPVVTVRTSVLTFDFTLGEAGMPERAVIHGTSTDFACTGLSVLFSQAKERIELLTIAKSEPLRIRSKKTLPSTVVPPTPAPQVGVGIGVGQPPPAAPEVAPQSDSPAPPRPDSYYHAVLHDDVVLTQAGKVITAEMMDLWAHLVGNELPRDAIGDFSPPRERRPNAAQPQAPTDNSVAVVHPPAPETPVPTAVVDAQNDVIVTWAGRMELRPIESRPSELEREHLTARLTSPTVGRVEFSDSASGVLGYGAAVEYGATTKELVLSGSDEVAPILALPKSGRATAERISVSLSSGLAMLAGKGELRSTDSGKNAGRVLTWHDRAEFDFVTSGGNMTGVLRGATIVGDAAARDRAAFLRGGWIQATFTPVSESAAALTRLLVRNQAWADDGKGASLCSEELDAAFRARPDSSGESDIEFVTARGNAIASHSGSTLSGELIEAAIDTPEKGRSEVRDVIARKSVRFEREDGVWARADELTVDPGGQIADLSGENAAVGRGPTQVSGAQIRLDGVTQTLTVFGAGEFDHDPSDGSQRGHASWSRQMTFDDLAGNVVCFGDVIATIRPDESTTRQVHAAEVAIDITPRPDSRAGATSEESGDRRLLRFVAIGESYEDDAGQPARLESTVHESPAEAGGERRLVEAVSLEGVRILVDDVAGTLVVPSAGKLLWADRRPPPADAGPEKPVEGEATDPTRSARGEALFAWDGDLKADRATGTAVLTRGVKMTHRALGQTEFTRLESDGLTARFGEEQPASPGQALRGRFLSATALGAVWAGFGKREMTADRMEYDADHRIVKAEAFEGNVVTAIDPAATGPVQAVELLWDIARDRIEVKKPATIVLPK